MLFDADPAPHARTLLAGLAVSPLLVALFDGEDRLLWCNRAFASLFGVDQGVYPTWMELMRNAHERRCGSVVQAPDFEVWLASAASRRGKQAWRSFEGDMHDGRWFSMAEQLLEDGSLLCIGHEVTGLRADERTLRLARDVAERQAHSDPLTGLGNRRYVMQALSRALEPPRCADSFLALVDLDHFKRINDEHGHQRGDRVLCDFARLLMSVMRRGDLIGRIGGEEFLILLPGVGRASAQAIMERLGAATRTSVPLPEKPDFRYTCSIGLVAIDAAMDQDALLREADLALYAAKQAGRDRCVLRPSDAPPPHA